jgi:hypothetical protein
MRTATRATAVALMLALAGCLGARTESPAPVMQNAAGSWVVDGEIAVVDFRGIGLQIYVVE